MPRLIKLASSNEIIADFSNFFTEDIVIKPNSKVALYSLSITLNDMVFEVTAVNCSFQAQVLGNNGSGGRGGLKNVTLQVGEYNKQSFQIELTRALNSAFLINSGSNNGLTRNEWKPIYDSTNKLIIQYNATCDDAGSNINMQLGTFSFSSAAANANLQKVGTDGVWQSCYATNIFQNGVGQIACTTAAALQNGSCIGLINDITNALALAPTDYYACVYTQAGNYWYFANGLSTNSGVAVAANQVMSVTLTGGLLTFAVDGNTIGTVGYTFDQQLHGAVSSLTNANIVSSVIYSPSPYQNSNANGVSIVERNEQIQDHENYIMFGRVGAIATAAAQHRLLLTNASASLLGFNATTHNAQSLVSGSFTGDRPLYFNELANNLMVEIPSLDLSGYDGESHRRRNILSILPADDQVDVQRFYQAVYPIYIDINNRNEQLLNTIQIRVLDEAGIPVNINPISGVLLTILLD